MYGLQKLLIVAKIIKLSSSIRCHHATTRNCDLGHYAFHQIFIVLQKKTIKIILMTSTMDWIMAQVVLQ